MRRQILVLGATFFILHSYARPRVDPVDYSKIEGSTRKKAKPLLEGDLTYTNENIAEKAKDPRVMRLLFPVQGRSLPSRRGKVLESFKKGDYVKALFLSQKSYWVAVQSLKSSKKRWIPKNSLPSFDVSLLKSDKNKKN